jgi:hypothetical protein
MRSGNTTVYWVFTLLFVVPLGLSGVTYLMQIPVNVQGVDQLGYPHYIMPFLGVAKILGVIAILWERSKTLKEWAYAGFTLELLLATWSGIEVGHGLRSLFPFIMLLIMFVSYAQWKMQHPLLAPPKAVR